MQRERRLTKGETPEAPTKKLSTSLARTTDSGQGARRTARFDSRRVRARRLIVRELDEFLGIFRYPDPAVIYAVAPSREALDELVPKVVRSR
jgi:hypothetical protein